MAPDPDPDPLPETCTVAFKEWAGVCAAIASGRQSLILRKGGISEGPGGFTPEHPAFWLYPTFVHEGEQGLKAAPPLDRPADATTVPIDTLVVVVGVARVDELDMILGLADLHVWTEETVRKRFDYRKPGLWVLDVRAYRRPEPWSVEITPAAQLGCKTWVPLDAPLPTAGLVPVRSVQDDAEESRPARGGDRRGAGLVNLRAEIREAPATYGLVASWVVTYLLMNWYQGGFISEGEWFTGFGSVRPETTHLFGDLTWRDFSHGQVWRALTATFIHFSFTHLLLNSIGMIQLGRMMEEWYGPRQFLAACLAIGGLGNVLGVLMRQGGDLGILWIQAHGMGRILPPILVEAAVPGLAQVIPSAGGSTIILGLIGLGLVVGWRSKTRVGLFLRDQMFGFLAFTAVIGLFCMKFMDNYGHAGGAMAGMAAGFLHRRLVRTAPGGPARRLAAMATAAVFLASVGGQTLADRREIAESRRAASRQESQVQVELCGMLVQGMKPLAFEFESIAYQRLGQSLASIADLDFSGFDGPPDYSPIAALSALESPRPVPPWQPLGPSRQELLLFSRGLAGLGELRQRIDARVDGPEFGEILAIGAEILKGPVESKDIYAFRLACRATVMRAASVRGSLLGETGR